MAAVLDIECEWVLSPLLAVSNRIHTSKTEHVVTGGCSDMHSFRSIKTMQKIRRCDCGKRCSAVKCCIIISLFITIVLFYFIPFFFFRKTHGQTSASPWWVCVRANRGIWQCFETQGRLEEGTFQWLLSTRRTTRPSPTPIFPCLLEGS